MPHRLSLLLPLSLALSLGCGGAGQVLPTPPTSAAVTLHDLTLTIDAGRAVTVEDHLHIGEAPRAQGAITLRFPAGGPDPEITLLSGDPATVLSDAPAPEGAPDRLVTLALPRGVHALSITQTFREGEGPHPGVVFADDALVLLSGAKGYYPRVEGGDTAFRFTVDAPRAWHVAGPGVLMDRGSEGSRQIQRFVADTLLPHLDLAIGALTLAALPQGAGQTSPRIYLRSAGQRVADAWLHAAERQLAHVAFRLAPMGARYYTLVEIPEGSDFTLAGGLALTRSALEDAPPDEVLGQALLKDAFALATPAEGEGDWRPAAITYLMSLAPVGDTLPPDPSERREAWLRDWRSVTGADAPRPLIEAGTQSPERVGRGAMVLHQLSLWIGEDAFTRGLRALAQDRRPGAGGWTALADRMEAEAGQDLRFFFDPWLGRLGAPRLTLLRAEEALLDLGEAVDPLPVLNIRVGRDGFPAPLKVPVVVELTQGRVRRVLTLDGPMVDAPIPLQPPTKEQLKALDGRLGPGPLPTFKPRHGQGSGNAQLGGSRARGGGLGRVQWVRVDPDFDALRDLWPAELLPRVGEILEDPRAPVLIGPGANIPKEAELLATLLDRPTLAAPDAQRGADLGTIIAVARWEGASALGLEVGDLRLPLPRDLVIEPGVVWYGLKPYSTDRVVAVVAVPAPWDPKDRALIILSPGPSALREGVDHLTSVGQAGFLLIDEAGPVAKGRYEPGENPLMLRFPDPTPAAVGAEW